jgi:hypothetical protein
VRQSPLKSLVASLNLIVAIECVLLPRSAHLAVSAVVALVSAVAVAASMTDYVRSITQEVAHADGFRNEQDRRIVLLARHHAGARLRRLLSQPMLSVSFSELSRAVEEGETAGIAESLLFQARSTLSRVIAISALKSEVHAELEQAERAKRDAAEDTLRTLLRLPPGEVPLGKLGAAIKVARALGVKRANVVAAESVFSEATRMRALRERAAARLLAYVQSAEQPQATPPTETPPEEGGEAHGGKSPTHSSIDIKELDSALVEARKANADPKLIERATELRKDSVMSQVALSEKATLFYLKLRRKHLGWPVSSRAAPQQEGGDCNGGSYPTPRTRGRGDRQSKRGRDGAATDIRRASLCRLQPG